MVEPKPVYRLGSVDWLREMVPWLNFGYLVGLSLLLTEGFVTAVESITNCVLVFSLLAGIRAAVRIRQPHRVILVATGIQSPFGV